ncbi:MAG: uncharacterized protein K0Q51_1582, partial [Rickettsiaceae bacterium]|nr:uncharacterized protein [Rickettsiaceae bacterium]
NTYLQVAASSDNSDFVYEILSSIKQQIEKMGLEQRIFNLEALKLSQFYKSHDKLMELLRHLGASEYRAQGDYEEAYTKDNQNVHRAEFTNPLLEAVKKLEKHYNSNANFIETQCIEFERFFHSLIQEIGKREDLRKGRSEEDYLLDFLERYKCSVLRVKATDSDSVNKKIFYLKEFLKGAEITVSRIIDSQSFTNAYEREINAIAKNNNFPQTNTVHDHYTLKHALAFTWAGLKDPSAMAERKIDDLEVFERKLLLIVTLYETYQEGIEDSLKQNKGEIESISSEESLDIPYEKQEISQLARGDSNLPLKTKVDGLICYTGLFDRIITRLDAQHKLVNIDNVKPPVISVSDDLIKTFFKDWEKDLLHKVPITLLAKIYDNFEVLKKANLSVKFIPLQQYITGIFKKAFIEYVELGYFGNLENGLQSRDFEIIEDTIKRTSLINPIREALDFIQKKGMPNSYFHLLALKIYITSEIENAPILHSLRLIEKQKDFINNLPDFEDISPIFKIALLIRNSELLKGSKNLVLDLENYKLIKKTSESLQEELQRKASCDEVEGDQEVIKAIRSIAKKPQLDILDILKLQLITSNYLYESYSLTKLFKLAVEYDNHFMLKLIINNAESLYERDIALNKTFKSPIDYRNKYLDKVACKNFYKGLTILHIAAIHCKSNETFDLLFYYREFRDKIDFQDDQGCTPFFTASFIGNEIAINKLIEYGADANILNNNGDSPLHFIVRHFNSKFINKLFEKGMSPFAIDNESRTFIHSLAQATKNSVTNDKDYVTFKEGLLKNIPISNDILPYFDGTVKAIFEAMDTESTSVEAKHFPVHTYEQELNDYLESKDKFIEEYRSGHLDITSLTKDSIYSLLLNTAIVLQNAKAVKSILKMTHNENIFTYIDDTGYSPISHALDYADENILTLLKDYIKTHKDSIKKLTNMDQQEKDNFLNILTYFKYDKLDPKECLNEYLLPLYTEEALTSDIIGLIDELEEHIGHYY